MPDDAYFAPRACLASHPPESALAIDLLTQATDAVIAGEADRIPALLIQANMPALRTFSLRVMGKLDPTIHRYRKAPTPNRPLAKHAERMPPRSAWLSIFRRDGFHCRFCGTRVVHPDVRSRLRAIAPDAVPNGRSNTYHAAFLALNATLDHVIPHAAGGDNDPDNLVTTCWPCNFGRGSYSLAELGLIDPRLRPPVASDWDGLSRLLARPAAKPKLAKVPKTRIDHPQPVGSWREAIESIHPGAARHLLAIAQACGPLGVSHAIRKECVIRLTAGNETIIPIGATRTGDVEIPWFIGPHKAAFRPFAEYIAAAIPGAVVRETPKTWSVRMAGGRKIALPELLAAEVAVVRALRELSKRLHPAD